MNNLSLQNIPMREDSTPHRIGLVSHSPLYGGAEKMLLKLACLLRDKTTWEPTLFIPDFGKDQTAFWEHAADAGLEPVSFRRWYWPQHIAWYPAQFFAESALESVEELSKYLTEKKIELVISNTITNIVTPMAAVQLGLPCISWLHEAFEHPGREILKKFERFILQNSEKVFCCSEWISQFYKKNYSIKAQTQWNWTEKQEQLPTRGDHPPLFVCLNNYHEHKGFRTLIEACRLLRKKAEIFQVHLYGAGIEKERIIQWIKESDLTGHVTIFDPVKDIDHIYQQADVLVQPSDIEPFGLTVIEAMSHKLPVIATRSGGPEEIVLDGETGFLVPVGDAETLSNRMYDVLTSIHQAGTMGEAGYYRFKEFYTQETVFQTMIPAIDSVLTTFQGHTQEQIYQMQQIREYFLNLKRLDMTSTAKELKTKLAIIHDHCVGKGKIGIDGELGFEESDELRNRAYCREYAYDLSYERMKVQLRPEFSDWQTIGAHTNSLLDIEFTEPVELCGGLNGSAFTVRKPGTLQFLINGTVIGEADGPMSMTDRLVIPAGRYRLETRALTTNEYCHTVWAFRPCTKELATIENTAFLSVAAFPNVSIETKLFMDSAKKCGVPVTLIDVEEKWEGFFQHKILNMLAYFKRLREEGKRFVMSLDCRDMIFIHPVDILLAKFNGMNDGKIVIASDIIGFSHPVHRFWILMELQKLLGTPSVEINTGVLIGEIDSMIRAYEEILTLREEYIQGHFRTHSLERLHQECELKWVNDDQFLHYLNILVHPDYYDVDGRKRLSAFVSGYRQSPSCLDDPREEDSICTASIIHGSRLTFPGPWVNWNIGGRSRWWVPAPTDQEEIPVKLERLEINIIYTCNLKCNYCTHFGKHVEGVVDSSEIRRWCDLWRDRLRPEQIRILGGEPLLHPDCIDILREVRIRWPHTKLLLVTNGLLQPSDELIRILRETYASVLLSRHFDHEGYSKAFEKSLGIYAQAKIPHDVEESRYGFVKAYRLDREGRPLPFTSDQGKAWNNCYTKNHSTTLLDGCLYKCPQLACASRAYQMGELSQTWSRVMDYKPLQPNVSYEALVRFANEGAVTACSICPEKFEYAAPAEKAGKQR